MISALHHVTVEVDDLDAAIAFYELIGLTVLQRPSSLGPGTWLGIGAHQVHLVVVDEMTPRGSEHMAFEVSDIETEVARLRQAGIEASDPFDLGAGVQSFLRDPAGNLIELNQPTA